MSLAEEEERAPGVSGGKQQRKQAGEQAEAAGGRRPPLLHGEALALLHRQVGAQPHALGEEQAAAAEVVAVLRQRHHHHEAEQKGQEVADALREEEIVERHGEAGRAEEAAGGHGEAGWRRGARGAGRDPGPPESPGAARRPGRSRAGGCAVAAPAGPERPARDACAAAERGPRLWSAPRTAAGGKAAKLDSGRGRATPGTWAPTRKRNENQEAGGPRCRLTETRLWDQELRVLASHGTVPWSPAPTSALRGEGRERGAQRDESEMPTGSGGSEVCGPGWNDSLSGLQACTKYRGHETERGEELGS